MPTEDEILDARAVLTEAGMLLTPTASNEVSLYERRDHGAAVLLSEECSYHRSGMRSDGELAVPTHMFRG
jgi:hypothetical protein